jgi:hypothetical protein
MLELDENEIVDISTLKLYAPEVSALLKEDETGSNYEELKAQIKSKVLPGAAS